MDLDRCLALASELRGRSPIGAPTEDEAVAVLDFARAVAHASERKSAPLAAYAVGLAAGNLDASTRVALLVAATKRIDSEVAGGAS